MKKQIDLRFPRDVQKRVVTLLTLAMKLINSGKIKALPKPDKVIHDILCDYYGNKRIFDVYDPDKEFKDRLEEIKHMTKEELIRDINMMLQGHDIISII
jgi:hypothetical protein